MCEQDLNLYCAKSLGNLGRLVLLACDDVYILTSQFFIILSSLPSDFLLLSIAHYLYWKYKILEVYSLSSQMFPSCLKGASTLWLVMYNISIKELGHLPALIGHNTCPLNWWNHADRCYRSENNRFLIWLGNTQSFQNMGNKPYIHTHTYTHKLWETCHLSGVFHIVCGISGKVPLN